MILSAQEIRELEPVWPIKERTSFGGVTFGLSPAGYDIRLAEPVWLWPGRFVLVAAQEFFQLPADLLGVVHDKSTWARRGVAVQNTVIEPGWFGYLTLELTMHACRFLHIPAGVGIAQVIFHRLSQPTEQLYEGKYQGQCWKPQEAL